MSLVFKFSLPSGTEGNKFDYKEWYEKNKQRLSEKKKTLYLTDKEYRESAIKRSTEQRQKRKVELFSDGYTISLSQAADMIGVTVWTLREWRKKYYFPEPKHKGNRVWFHPQQIPLLEKLQHFFYQNGVRTSKEIRPKLEALIQEIASQWEIN